MLKYCSSKVVANNHKSVNEMLTAKKCPGQKSPGQITKITAMNEKKFYDAYKDSITIPRAKRG
jgi:hypothetical protein